MSADRNQPSSSRAAETAVTPSTLVDWLHRRGTAQADELAYTWLDARGEESATLCWGELRNRSLALAARIRAQGCAGQRALLLLPPSLDFIAGFFACLSAGAVAVPAYPPASKRHLPRLRAIVRDARPRCLLVPAQQVARLRSSLAGWPELDGVRWITIDDAAASDMAAFDAPGDGCDPEPGEQDLAFLQYTSGSTAAPKGVMITHGNLMANQEVIRQGFATSAESVVVGWLPLFHDMGLIGNVLQPLYLGARCVLMAPVDFLRRPALWLEAISRYRATTSGGPDFAYALCARRIAEGERERLDLSCWRTAFSGAEPVRAHTLDLFAATFRDQGFDPRAFLPCYGLAESTLMVSGAQTGGSPPTLSADAGALERGEIRPGEGPTARRLVSCGGPGAGHRVRIVDPESRRSLEDDRVGEVWVAGASVAEGYWNRPEATAETFGATLADAGASWLRTGDLGFFHRGALYITGRLKDLIIVRGRNLYPQDLELTAEQCDSALLPASGAAFSVERDGEERLVLVHEVHRHAEDLPGIARRIRRAVAEAHEVAVDEVVLIRPASLPKTSSGKVQRAACRAEYVAGELRVLERSAARSEEGASPPLPEVDRPDLEGLAPEARRRALADSVRDLLLATGRFRPSELDLETPLTTAGLDSLGAVELSAALESHLGVELPIAELLSGATPRELAATLDELWSRGASAEPSPAADATDLESTTDHLLSWGQRALWHLQRLEPESPVYIVAGAGRLRGPLDPAALARAFAGLCRRHAALRTTFELVDGEPRPRVHERLDGGFLEVRLDAFRPGCLEELAQRPFDLESGPPARLAVVEAGASTYLVLALHHLVGDFRSLEVLLAHLGELYAAEVGAAPVDVALERESPRVSYVEWARRQRERLAGPEGERLVEVWRQRLEGFPTTLPLPFDRPRPQTESSAGSSRAWRSGRGVGRGLAQLARRHGATSQVATLAAFQVLLMRISGRRKVLVGSPTTLRDEVGLAETVGYFVNPVILRGDASPEASGASPSFADFLERTRADALTAYDHRALPFPRLVERLPPEGESGRSPYFQVMLTWQRDRGVGNELASFLLAGEGVRLDLGGLELEAVELEASASPFELTLSLAESEGALAGRWTYRTDLFDGTTVERLGEQLRTLLQGIVRDPSIPVDQLPLLTSAQRHQVLHEWNDEPSYRLGALVHLCIAEVALERPDAVAAVADDGTHRTYGRLLAETAGLARELRRRGVGPETLVPVLCQRSLDMVVGLLAVVSAGGAYLPLDPEQPEERLAAVLDDARRAASLPLLLTQSAFGENPAGWTGAVLALDGCKGRRDPGSAGDVGRAVESLRELSASLRPEHPMYVIHTSGSTGRPKGVVIPHSAVSNRIHWVLAREPEAARAMLQKISLTFDISVVEVFAPLAAGGRLVITRPGGQREPEYLLTRAAEERVAQLSFSPSQLQSILEQRGLDACPGLRSVVTGGETVPPELPGRVLDQAAVEVTNRYGPTETTISVALWACGRDEGPALPIGRPIGRAKILLLDRWLDSVPPGSAGELAIAGPGLARGYLGRPAETALRFVPHPLAEAPGERIYRSGDLARQRADGALMFLGRIDQQVKVRGFRIELGDVEAAVGAHPGVREAAVVDFPGGEGGSRRLAAFVVPRAGQRVDVGGLRQFLDQRLPAYMVPATFVDLDALPLTTSGKVDRKALPPPDWTAAGAGTSTALSTPTEELVAEAWAAVLGETERRIGADDNFFDLGGHSLLATRAVSHLRQTLGVELPLRELFEAPTVASLARRIDDARRRREGIVVPPLGSVARSEGPVPLSFAQERLWFLDRLEPGSAAYNIPAAVCLRGPLEISRLTAALGAIVARHEALRTVFREAEGKPEQVVRPASAEWALPLVDLSALEPRSRQARAAELAREEASRTFDLAAGPLVRATLLRRDAAEHHLLLTFHHIVADGWSLGVFVDELANLLLRLSSDFETRGPKLAPLPVQYRDFAVWQRSWLTEEVMAGQLEWWREQLEGIPPLELPLDRPRGPVPGGRGRRVALHLEPELTAGVRRLARDQGATAFMVLLSALGALLTRVSGQRRWSVGTPIANRGRKELEGLIGFFVNTLVLPADLDRLPRSTFAALLEQVREHTLGAYAHQDLPFEKLVEALQPDRASSHTPLFQVMLVYHNDPVVPPKVPGLEMELLPPAAEGTTKFDCTVTVLDHGETLEGYFEYDRDLFDHTRMRRLVGHFRSLLRGGIESPEADLFTLPMLARSERFQLLAEWNDTSRPLDPLPADMLEQFRQQAARQPDAVALEWIHGEAGAASYGELLRRIDHLSRDLLARGIAAEDRVGLLVERSPAFVVAMLGVLGAGAAFLPLDPEYPRERLESMLADGEPRIVLVAGTAAVALGEELRSGEGPGSDFELLELDFGGRVLEPARGSSRPLPTIEPDRPAYVIYTSGSTGKPKGIVMSHGPLVNLARWQMDRSAMGVGSRTLQLASPNFDVSYQEVLASLGSGGTLVLIAEPLRRDAVALAGLLRATRIERLFLPFVALEQLAVVATSRDLVPEALREVVTAGEQLRITEALTELFRRLPGASLENQYGPSEAHVITAEPLRGDPAQWPRLPAVGRVIDETRIYLLDRRMRPVPPGVPGELAVGGRCLARGYLGRAALTAASFVPDPFTGGGNRLYRTGDLVRQLGDGRYEFLGRIDHQVKIRGYRVELAEIEVALVAHPEIRQAVVSAHGTGGQRRLVAHVETSAALDLADLRSFLGETLPAYMVPTSFVWLERLPLMNNGKVDRRALPEPEARAEEASAGRLETPYEELVAAAFAEVLELPSIDRDDNFFTLGGHSLLATQVVSRLRSSLGVEVPLQELFDSSTVRELAARLESGVGSSERVSRLPAIEPLGDGEEQPLSFAQERMWFIDRLTPGHPAYHIAATVRLSGELDVRAFHLALAGVEARQAGLRCCFEEGDTGPLLRVRPPSVPALPRLDLEGLPAAVTERELDHLARGEALRPFDLEHGPLLRATLVRLAPRRHALFLTLHHIVADGWSMGVLVRELGELYRAARDGRAADLPPLPVSYAAFAAWQRKWLRGEALEALVGWWREQLRGAPERLELPTDRPRPRIQTWRSGIYRLPLGRDLSLRLRSVSRQQGATLFMTLLAGFQAVLARYSGKRDVVLGSPIANRTRGELEGLIGLFVNTLVLRQDLSGDPTFAEHLDRVRGTTLAAYAHQDCPFEKLVEALRPQRDLGYTPLFQVMLVLQNAPLEVRLPGLRLEPLPVASGAAKFDLTVSVTEGFDAPELGAAFEYNRDLFDRATIVRLAGHWRRLLESATEVVDQPLSRLRLLSAAEEAQLTTEHNAAPAPEPELAALPRNLFALFARRAGERPDAVALSGESGWQMTYGELLRRALCLAARLRQDGVEPGDFVGLFLDRSPAQVVAMLGTLAAGAAYVPIDPAYPGERVAWIAEDSGFRLLLTDPGARSPLPREIEGLRRVAARDLLAPTEAETAPIETVLETVPVELHPEAVAYVIYTSGSTGKPKGSPISHRNVASLLLATQRPFRFDSEQVFTLFHSYAFDFSIWEIWGALAWGGRVAVVPYAVSRSPRELRRLLDRERVTVLSQTPSAFLQLVPEMIRAAEEDRATGASLRHVVFGGEALEPARLAPWLETFGDGSENRGARLVNMYGITETTVHVTYRLLTSGDAAEAGRSPVGRPLDHLRTYLLDPHGHLVPTGVVGEIHVGGEGLGHGYLHRPALTACRFVPSPFGPPGARLYRSGDLARLLPSGELDFLGRLDHQVKIRGFRIELGEIESALASDPAVADVAVLALGTADDVRLVAYLVIEDETEGVEARLRARLGDHLPGYMCPAAYVWLDQLPMTEHGKLDRRALPDPGGERPEIETVYREPETALEIVLCEVWAEALDVEQVGLDDNFFELGGHSLLATRIIAWVRETLEVEIPLTHLFEAPTVTGLATALVADPATARRVRRTAELLLEMADDPLEDE